MKFYKCSILLFLLLLAGCTLGGQDPEEGINVSGDEDFQFEGSQSGLPKWKSTTTDEVGNPITNAITPRNSKNVFIEGTATTTATTTAQGFVGLNLISCDTIDTNSDGDFICGADASGGGGGGSGNVATSTAETDTEVAFWTSTAATPATLGSDAGLIYISGTNALTLAGVFVSDGLTMGANENLTLGAQTLDHDGTDFVFNDTVSASSGSKFGTLTLADGSITDSSGAVTFVNENLATTGTLASGVLTVTGVINTSVGIDAVGAVDLDIGSGDVLDVTVLEDGGTYIFDNGFFAIGENLGSATAEWNDLFLNDGGIIQLGNDQDVTITHVADVGILVNLGIEVDGLLNADGIVALGDGGDNFSIASDGIDIDTSGNITNAGTYSGGAIDIGTSNFTTGGQYIIDVDGTALGSAGSFLFGAGGVLDAGFFWDGSNVKASTTGGIHLQVGLVGDFFRLDTTGNATNTGNFIVGNSDDESPGCPGFRGNNADWLYLLITSTAAIAERGLIPDNWTLTDCSGTATSTLLIGSGP